MSVKITHIIPLREWNELLRTNILNPSFVTKMFFLSKTGKEPKNVSMRTSTNVLLFGVILEGEFEFDTIADEIFFKLKYG